MRLLDTLSVSDQTNIDIAYQLVHIPYIHCTKKTNKQITHTDTEKLLHNS